MGNTDIFDKMASKYDSVDRLEVNQVIISQLKKVLTGDYSGKKLIDYGCGTGEVGLKFITDFEQVIFADTSVNMLEIVQEKTMRRALDNTQTIQITEGIDLKETADVIIVSQVLLHVADTKEFLHSLYRTLNPEGLLVVIDFDKNELVSSDLVHNGFEQSELRETLKEIGYKNVSSESFYQRGNLFMGQEAVMFSLKAFK